MLTPMRARAVFTRYSVLVGALMIGACSGEVSSPANATQKTMQGTSMYAPSEADKALIGVVDGTYSVTFDPTKDESFALGPNHLDIPADGVCNLVTSGYGAAYWDQPCTPQVAPVTLTVVIANAASDHPSINFFPAMRFNPSKTVRLFMYAPHVTPTDAKNWLMSYCPDLGACFDESRNDTSLATVVDYQRDMLFRRVKHFSGYTVAERSDDGTIISGQ
ncbi:hypothetical protein BH11GEM2_BH11GEM2_36160 [soil metagenome]